MATQPRDEPIPVKRGSAGPERRQPATESGAKPRDEQLDRRQEAVRPTRRRGPELGRGRETAAVNQPPDVPPTDCDEEGNE